MTHSPEPWKVNESVPGDPDGLAEILDNDGHELIHGYIATQYGETFGMGVMQTTNVRRIVACVNFCQGMSMEYLLERIKKDSKPPPPTFSQNVSYVDNSGGMG